MRLNAAAALAAAFSLGLLGCAVPGLKDGAAIGGALGALLGAALGGDERADRALGGLAAGAALGAAIGVLRADPDAAGPDGDGDGVSDVQDNCPAQSNETQQDADGDGRGDACDPESTPRPVGR